MFFVYNVCIGVWINGPAGNQGPSPWGREVRRRAVPGGRYHGPHGDRRQHRHRKGQRQLHYIITIYCTVLTVFVPRTQMNSLGISDGFVMK